MSKKDADKAQSKAKGMPSANAVPAAPKASTAAEKLPLPAVARNQPSAKKSAAEWAYDRLILYIRNFENQLAGDQEIAMGFAGSDAGILKIEGLGFFEPDLITFYGRDEDGLKTQLVQHVTQLSMMLRAVPKAAPEEPPVRIGFRLASGWMGGESGDGSV